MNPIRNKIIPHEEVREAKGQSVVLCHGHFNIIHPGHVRYLEFARQQGEKLMVSIQGDNSLIKEGRKEFFPEEERAAGVASLHLVDQVVLLHDSSLKDLIEVLIPDLLVLGKEFEYETHEHVSGAIQLLEKQGGLVLYHAGEHHYASSDLLREDAFRIGEERLSLFKKACHHQAFTGEDLIQAINRFHQASLLVIGDTIVDQYVACDALGMSAEAPIIVARELESKEYVGGAAIVAAHVKALGAKCQFISVVGQDSNAVLVDKELKRLRVEHKLLEDRSRPTTFKIRYMVDTQKMFRISRLKEHSIPRMVEEQLIAEIRNRASGIQGILISDFVYGIITPRILKVVRELATRHSLMVFGDLQCSSQVGNVAKFRNFNLLCPTERETRIALGTHDKGLEWMAKTLMEKTETRNLIMKLGSEGFIVYESKTGGFINRQHFPALNPNPVDVSGAGDSLLSTLSAGICSGAPLMQSSALSACVAALAVETVGNVPVSKQRLLNFLSGIKNNL